MTGADGERSADDRSTDVEGSERSPGGDRDRFDVLEEDLKAVERSIDALRREADDLIQAVSEDVEGESGSEEGADPAATWAEATLDHGVLGLLVADARAEFDELRQMVDRRQLDEDELVDAVESRLYRVDGKLTSVGTRLDYLDRPAWRERFDDVLSGFESAIAELEPPVDWGEIETSLEEYRSQLDGER